MTNRDIATKFHAAAVASRRAHASSYDVIGQYPPESNGGWFYNSEPANQFAEPHVATFTDPANGMTFANVLVMTKRDGSFPFGNFWSLTKTGSLAAGDYIDVYIPLANTFFVGLQLDMDVDSGTILPTKGEVFRVYLTNDLTSSGTPQVLGADREFRVLIRKNLTTTIGNTEGVGEQMVIVGHQITLP